MGKKTQIGQKTHDNLCKVLASINGHEYGLLAESRLELHIVSEMREYARVPRSTPANMDALLHRASTPDRSSQSQIVAPIQVEAELEDIMTQGAKGAGDVGAERSQGGGGEVALQNVEAEKADGGNPADAGDDALSALGASDVATQIVSANHASAGRDDASEEAPATAAPPKQTAARADAQQQDDTADPPKPGKATPKAKAKVKGAKAEQKRRRQGNKGRGKGSGKVCTGEVESCSRWAR